MAALRAELRGWMVNKKRVQRIMREDNLLCMRKGSRWRRSPGSLGYQSHHSPCRRAVGNECRGERPSRWNRYFEIEPGHHRSESRTQIPLLWGPLLGIGVVVAKDSPSSVVISSLELIGSAASGVAVFGVDWCSPRTRCGFLLASLLVLWLVSPCKLRCYSACCVF